MPRRQNNSPRTSKRYHDRVARQYDTIYDDPYWAYHDELTWRTIKPHIPTDLSSKTLDLGCGTGKWGLKLLKSGFATTFVDNSGAMIEKSRQNVDALGPKSKRATLLIADIIDLSQLPSNEFSLTLAMGDPLSICSDPDRAAREMFRLCAPGGIVIATADNKLSAIDYYASKNNLDALEQFIHTSKTHWLTPDEREQFELTTFTPASLTKLFTRAGFEILNLIGKPLIPIRKHKTLLDHPDAMSRLLNLEHDLAKDPTTAATAAHLQITAKKIS